MKDVVVVGGGIAGLLAGLALKGRHRVVIVDKAPELGGLMRSTQDSDGTAFDFGTHVLGETGNPRVDAVMFGRIANERWRAFRMLKTGSFFNGRLFDKSPHVDLRSLPKDLYEKAAAELLADAPPWEGEPRDFAEQLRRDFGPTVTEAVQRPAMRKIFACELEELLPDNPFTLKRFVAFDEARSRELKKDRRLDAKLAFATYEDGVPATRSFYPKRGGVGQWAQDICAELVSAGIRLATGHGVAKVEHEDGAVKAVVLDDGQRLPCDALLWTAPPFLLLKAMALPYPAAPLKARPMSFFHFRFDRPFPNHNYYVTNYDQAFKTFRVTLYPNLQERSYDGVHHCTVEVIGEGIGPGHRAEIRAELDRMGITDPAAETVGFRYDSIAVGFPTLTKAFLAAAQEQVELVKARTRGVELLGRLKHDAFSIQAVAVEAYERALLV